MTNEVRNPRRRFGRLVVAAALAASISVVGQGLLPFGVPAASAALGAGGEYHPLTPSRILDTRRAESAPTGLQGFGTAFGVQVSGSTSVNGGASGVPANDVLAVVANITVTGTNRSGYLTAFPEGATKPNASNLNFLANTDVSNLALLRPGTNGRVSIVLETDGTAPAAGGVAHVVIDVVGWFSTSSAPDRGARLISLSPGRILDTRSGVARNGALGAGEQFTLPIRGADAINPSRADYVPADTSVSGVILNVTATGPTATTFVSLQPERFNSFPSTSSVNLRAGETKANLVMVPVGADGTISIFNESGSVQLIADVVGYYRDGVTDESRAGRIVPISSPFRAFDTRLAEFFATPAAPGQEDPWDFDDDSAPGKSFVDSVKIDGVPVGAIGALLMNFTAVPSSFPSYVSRKDSYLTVYPGGTTLPDSSNVNVTNVTGAVPNFVVAALSAEDKLNVYNDNGFVHYLGDVAAVVLE